MFTMVNILSKKQIQPNQELKEIETKNSDKEDNSYTPKYEPNDTEYQRGEILDDLMFSHCLQKCGYCVLAKLTTLNMLGLYSKWLKDAFQSSFSR